MRGIGGVVGQQATTVVAGAVVVPRAEQGSVIQDGAVVIRGKRIAEVGPSSGIVERYPGASIIDAAGKLVIPGFINCHTHLYSSLARGLTADIEPSSGFMEVLEHLWWRLDRALTDEDVWCSAAVGALDLIRNGTTMVFDHHASQEAVPGSLSAIADALTLVGLRANLCFEVSDRNGAKRRDEGLAENERFARSIRGRPAEPTGGFRESHACGCADRLAAGVERGVDGEPSECPAVSEVEPGGMMLSASFGLHASFTLEDETLERAGAAARDLGIGCHVHVAEDRADVEDSVRRSGKRVVDRLNDFGILGSKTIAAHCVHIDDGERVVLGETDTIVVHNPESNMKNGVGCAAIAPLLEQGVLVGLGTDGFSSSMFDEMRVANLIHTHVAGDPRAGAGLAVRLCAGNNPVIASRLIGDRVGQLVPDALADLIVLDYTPPTPLVEQNFGAHLLFGLTGRMVETVIIGGRVVMEDREFKAVDEGEILAESRDRARDLWNRM